MREQQEQGSTFLRPHEVSDLLGVSETTLATWRCTHRVALPFVKIGRCVRYKAADIFAFIDRQTRGGDAKPSAA